MSTTRTMATPTTTADAMRQPDGPVGRADPPRGWFGRLILQEDLNFLLTNRIPRHLVTRFMGWFSRIEQPWLCRLSLAVWRRFADDLDLSDAKRTQFRSLHDCFIRELRDGARPVDPDPALITSPCDAIVGACGRLDGSTAIQAKGFPYALEELLGDAERVARHRDGLFVTLRLKSTMYHRFHAPCEGAVREVNYISGDTWNVNPIALKRVERLFCRNERAVIAMHTSVPTEAVTLVAVAAILVASIRLHFLGPVLDLAYRGPNRIACDARFGKGDEMGYFQHGSTILVFAAGDFDLAPGVAEGTPIRMGQALLRRRSPPAARAQ